MQLAESFLTCSLAKFVRVCLDEVIENPTQPSQPARRRIAWTRCLVRCQPKQEPKHSLCKISEKLYSG